MNPGGGFGGMQYGFDLISLPYKIANMSTGSIELVSNSILRVGWVICGLLLLEMRSEREVGEK